MVERVRVPWSERHERVAELLARHEREGRSVRDLAREVGLPMPAIYGWLKRLRLERAVGGCCASHCASFVELVATPATSVADDDRSLEIVLRSGLRIWIGDRFDADALKRLVSALGG